MNQTQQFLGYLDITTPILGYESLAEPSITECTFIASYNWHDCPRPTILVPGAPPRWLPPATFQRLREDRGDYYRDPNAARYPRWPLGPAVQSIYTLRPDFRTDEVDIFCCASIIGSLLAVVRGENKTFQFGIQKIGNTVLLVRESDDPQELIRNVRGYGHTFPEAYTVWPASVKGSASHQRIVKYRFGELRCLVRSECDGYLAEHVPDHVNKALDRLEPNGVGLEDQVGFVKVAETRSDFHATADLEVRKAGYMIPQRSVFDLKTRSALSAKTLDSENFLARLWANQTSNFVLARHRRGVFSAIEIVEVRDRVKAWEKDNHITLKQLHTLLKDLSAINDGRSMSRLEIRRRECGKLEVWSSKPDWFALPPELQKQWSGGK
ncbi:hypothetical protein H2200_008109 [Cladophialophora chaetospira]|uniref:Geranylgeranyl pyrophosphate synthetase n=1 Tax=Cladophialophora chaetospira TaxID=386627 RepID=A0AA38X5C1_9EURO|nr:hypothetical protein H2200_008109 [Cladophialophora chaetospira]